MAVLVCALAACGSGGSDDETITVHGTFSIADPAGYERTGGDCNGVGGYSDLNEGTGVEVEAADNGDRVARTTLGAGAERVQRGGVVRCEFTFSFEVDKSDDVDDGGFVVRVGDRRGEQQYSFTELKQNPDAVDLVIG